jgi:hypothetical protein
MQPASGGTHRNQSRERCSERKEIDALEAALKVHIHMNHAKREENAQEPSQRNRAHLTLDHEACDAAGGAFRPKWRE